MFIILYYQMNTYGGYGPGNYGGNPRGMPGPGPMGGPPPSGPPAPPGPPGPYGSPGMGPPPPNHNSFHSPPPHRFPFGDGPRGPPPPQDMDMNRSSDEPQQEENSSPDFSGSGPPRFMPRSIKRKAHVCVSSKKRQNINLI